MRARRAVCLAALLVCLLAACAPAPAAGRALSRALPEPHARRLAAASVPSDAAPADGDAPPSAAKYDRGVFHVHVPVWLIVLVVLTACCILSGCCVAQHSQFFLVLCILKGIFAALCCLKSFNWDEIMKGARGNAFGASAAGGADPTVQLAPSRAANEHTPLTKVL